MNRKSVNLEGEVTFAEVIQLKNEVRDGDGTVPESGRKFEDYSISELVEIVKKRKRAAKYSNDTEAATIKLEVDVSTTPNSSNSELNTPAASTNGHTEYTEDAYKTLDTVIKERGIPAVPKCYSSSPRPILKQSNSTPRLTQAAVESLSADHDAATDVNGTDSYKIVGDSHRKIKMLNVDPRAHSLDDMILKSVSKEEESVSTNFSLPLTPLSSGFPRGGQRIRKRKFEFNSSDDDSETMSSSPTTDGKKVRNSKILKQKLTPYRAVTFLTKIGMVIEFRIGRLAEDLPSGPKQDKTHLWRCIVSCNSVRGICDSERKVVAREIACHDFLVHMLKTYPDGKIPTYDIPPELFIDPRITEMMEKLARDRGMTPSYQITVNIKEPKEKRGVPVTNFLCTYYLGTNECTGEGTEVKYAKLNAANEAYKFFTGAYYPTTEYYTGQECPDNYEYTFNESEVYQVIDPVEEIDLEAKIMLEQEKPQQKKKRF